MYDSKHHLSVHLFLKSAVWIAAAALISLQLAHQQHTMAGRQNLMVQPLEIAPFYAWIGFHRVMPQTPPRMAEPYSQKG